MKRPEDAAIGGARKTLPSRRARKVPKASAASSKNGIKRKKRIQDLETELVKVFGEK